MSVKRRYNAKDDEIIMKNFPTMGRNVTALFPDRSPWSVISRCRTLGLTIPTKPNNAWTDDEIKILRENYTKMGGDIVRLIPRHSRQSVVNKAQVLKIPSPSDWSREEDRIIVKTCYDPAGGMFNYTDDLIDLLPDREMQSITARVGYLEKHHTSIAGGYPINVYMAINGKFEGYSRIGNEFYDIMERILNAIKNNTSADKPHIGPKIVEAMELHYKLGFDVADVAAEMGISEDSVRWLLSYGIKFAKQVWDKIKPNKKKV